MSDLVSPVSRPGASEEPRLLLDELHAICTRYGIPSYDREQAGFVSAIIKWAAAACRQTLALEAGRAQSAATCECHDIAHAVVQANEPSRIGQHDCPPGSRVEIAPPAPSADYCQGCGGRYRYDTSIANDEWNAVIRANNLPEYLCAACIIREFARRRKGFTATLWGDDCHGMQITVREAAPPAVEGLIEKIRALEQTHSSNIADDPGGYAGYWILADDVLAALSAPSRALKNEEKKT